MKPLDEKTALKEYPVTLELKFKSIDAREDFVARYLDGSGEQSIQCYTESTTVDGTWDTKISWHWEQPVLFINVDEYE